MVFRKESSQNLEREKKQKILLVIKNKKNLELLTDFLKEQYQLLTDIQELSSDVDLVIADELGFKDYKSQLKKIKEDQSSFIPFLLLIEQNKSNIYQSLDSWVKEIVKVPVSKKILGLRIKNLLRMKRLWSQQQYLAQKYTALFNNINDAVFLMKFVKEKTLLGSLTEVNQTMTDLLGYSHSELLKMKPQELEKTVFSEKESRQLFLKVKEQGEAKIETRLVSRQGKKTPVEINAKLTEFKNQRQILGVARDITAQKEKEKQINYISFHDELTDLYNRRFLEEEINRLDTKRQLPISLIMIDVNGLKLINDSYGHKSGDEALIKVAGILQEAVREEDIIARWGGDEFVILLPQTSKKTTQKIRERIEEQSAQTKVKGIQISLGMGTAVKVELDQDLYEILHKADKRMYQNKLTEHKSAKNKLVQNLLHTLGAKSNETEEHAVRMTGMAFKLGEKIGLTTEQLNDLSLLATLHDIGKVTIEEKILTKEGPLTEEEWEILKDHPERGSQIVLATEDFAPIAKYILAHHERWDGSGYPRGISKDKIPLLSRIISIVDAYDVMNNGRSYKEAMSQKEIKEELKQCAGSQFDPELVPKFVQVLEEA
ncbi:MAG: diguanylate cyclase domain-containing protein [Bacillota bacterium]